MVVNMSPMYFLLNQIDIRIWREIIQVILVMEKNYITKLKHLDWCFFDYINSFIKNVAYNGIDLILLSGLYPKSFVLILIMYFGEYRLL